MKRLLYIPFDQLNRDYGVLKNANPKTDEIVFVVKALSNALDA